MKESFHCKSCGILVEDYPSRRSTFCSRSCAMKGNKINIRNKYWVGKKHKESTKEKLSTFRKEFLKNNEHPKGMLGKKHTPEAIEKIRERSKERPTKFWLGKKKPQYIKDKVSASLKETLKTKVYSEEYRKMQSDRVMNNPNRVFKNTSIEVRMMSLLDDLGVFYEQQKSIGGIAIVDFFIPEKNLIIECDGCYWHGCPIHHPMFHQNARRKDMEKTARMEELGFKVIRFWEHEIKNISTIKI
jgi:DNA mismatch endonuclease (patch repair protein)